MPSLNTGNAILSNAIAVNSSYNVGIGGAASSSFKLQVTGTTNLTGALTGTSATFSGDLTLSSGGDRIFSINDTGGNLFQIQAAGNILYYSARTTGGSLAFRTNGTNDVKLSIASTGAATINAASANYATLNLNGAAGYGAELKFGEATGGYLAAIRHNFNVGTGLEFYTGGLAVGNLRMYIAPTGNVGIGTSSPSVLFTIGKIGTANQLGFYDGATAKGFIGISAGTSDIIATDALNDMVIRPSSAGNMLFAIGGTERMRITSGGNVLIGATSGLSVFPITISGDGSTKSGAIQFKNNGVDVLYLGTPAANDSVNIQMFNPNNGYIRFATNSEEKMRITSGGYLKASNNGSYSTGSSHELVNSAGGNYAAQFSNTHPTSPFGIQIYYPNTLNNTTNRFIDCEDNAALRFSARSNGGLANFQANDVNLSDERTKKDIIPLESYWDKFKAIEIVKFKYKDQTHDDFNIGVIAQQVESVAPEFVDIDGWDNKPKLDEDGNEIISNDEPLKSIYTADLYHATIKVLQEAMAKIEEQQAQIEAQQQQINSLINR
jgi:hypothetical protein